MSATFVRSSTAYALAVTTLSVTLSGAAANGNTLVLFKSGGGTQPITSLNCLNVSWTQAIIEPTPPGYTVSCEIWIGKVTGGTSGSTLLINLAGASNAAVVVSEFSGVSPSSPIDGTFLGISPGSTTPTYTSGNANDLIIACLFDYSGGAAPSAPGFTALTAVNPSGPNLYAIFPFYQVASSVGAFSVAFGNPDPSRSTGYVAMIGGLMSGGNQYSQSFSASLSTAAGGVAPSPGVPQLIALVNTSTFSATSSGSFTVPLSAPAAAGNVLLLFAGGGSPAAPFYLSAPPSCANVTWTAVGESDTHLGSTDAGEWQVWLGIVSGGPSGANVTVTTWGAGTLALVFAEFTGTTGALDGLALANYNASDNYLFTSPSYQPASSNGDLLFLVLGQYQGYAPATPAGWTALPAFPLQPASVFPYYQILPPGTGPGAAFSGSWQPQPAANTWSCAAIIGGLTRTVSTLKGALTFSASLSTASGSLIADHSLQNCFTLASASTYSGSLTCSHQVKRALSASASAPSGGVGTSHRTGHGISLSASASTCSGSLTRAHKAKQALSASASTCSGNLVRSHVFGQALSASLSTPAGGLQRRPGKNLAASAAPVSGTLANLPYLPVLPTVYHSTGASTSLSTSTTRTVSISQAAAGNLLILACNILDGTTTPSITSITCSNVTWTHVKSETFSKTGEYCDLEIWIGNVTAASGTSVQLTLSIGGGSTATATTVTEISGLSGIVDGSFVAGGPGSGLTLNSGSYSNANAWDLLMVFLGTLMQQPTNTPAGWTAPYAAQGNTSYVYPYYQTVSAIGAQSVSWSLSDASVCSSLIGGLKLAVPANQYQANLAASSAPALESLAYPHAAPSALSAAASTSSGNLTKLLNRALAASAATAAGKIARCFKRSLSAASAASSGSLSKAAKYRRTLAAASATASGSLSIPAKHTFSLAAASTASSGSLSSTAAHLIRLTGSLSSMFGLADSVHSAIAVGAAGGVSAAAATATHVFVASGALSGVSALTAAAIRVPNPTGLFSGASTLTAAGVRVAEPTGALAGTSAVTITGIKIPELTGTLSGASALVSAGTRIETSVGAFTGTSRFTAAAIRVPESAAQPVTGAIAAASTLAAVPHVVFNAIGNLPNGAWYTINPIRVALAEAESGGESSAGATWFIADVGITSSGASHAKGSAGRLRSVTALAASTPVAKAKGISIQFASGDAHGTGSASLNPIQRLTGYLAGANDLAADTLGYLVAQARAEGSSALAGHGQYCLTGTLAGGSTAALDCRLPVQGILAGLSETHAEASYLASVFGIAPAASALHGALTNSADTFSFLPGYSDSRGSAIQIFAVRGTADGRAEISALLRYALQTARALIGNCSTILGSITRLEAIAGEATGASLADASCNSNIVLATAACSDAASSLGADAAYFNDVDGSTGGANDCIADAECVFDAEAWERQMSTLQGTLTGRQTVHGTARSFYMRGQVVPKFVLAAAAASGASSEHYQIPPVLADLTELGGGSNLTGYLSGTTDASGKVWCLSYLTGKAGRTKPIAGAIADYSAVSGMPLAA